jgi:type IV pilus assembly protein PilB
MTKSILDVLAAKNIISLDEVAVVKKEAKEKNAPLEDLLYLRGIPEPDVAEAKAELSGVPARYLKGSPVPMDALHDLPEESARHYKMVPLGRKDGYIDIGMLNPEDVGSREAVKFISTRANLPVRLFVITPSDFDIVINQYRSLTGEVTKALGEFSKGYGDLREEVKISPTQQVKIVEDAPVTKIMAVILRHAVEGRASDIHIEPLRDRLRVRFRVDGVLYTSLLLPLDVHSAVLTRIKVVTNLKIDETRIPQDGRFYAEIGGRNIDFRVSTFPSANGEKAAIRILDPNVGVDTLSALGVGERSVALIEEGVKRPFGLILITGPTGSGKSTTLYALLKLLNRDGVNIVSLEDPVEYYIEGVNQSQIRPEIGYDFATGLRQILRQDPDIIMVGEIRDKETAAMAIHAALTGHLVLATLHTNNAVGVIPRLIDMGVDPYLIAPTLTLAIAQRLVRRLCDESRKKIKVVGKIKEIVEKEINEASAFFRGEYEKFKKGDFYQADISSTCPKGTRGRIGVFEVLSMTTELEEIILTGPSEAKILQEAKRQGMVTMRQDGIIKALNGIIGIEELLETT